MELFVTVYITALSTPCELTPCELTPCELTPCELTHGHRKLFCATDVL